MTTAAHPHPAHLETEQHLPINAEPGPVEDVHHGDMGGHGDLPPEAFSPVPSFWPIALTLTLTLLPPGALMMIWGAGTKMFWVGAALVAVGVITSLVPALGWFNSVIVDKVEGHFGPVAQAKDLTLGIKLFFLSEVAIFGSMFAFFFATLFSEKGFPRAGVLPLEAMYPAIGTLILMASSATCEAAHHALRHGNRAQSKNWLLLTIALGIVFLGIQGFEYGFIASHFKFTWNFSQFSTIFYTLTGFHGLHVMTGLIMLFLVYGRLEMGHYTKDRHISFNAASWYWHLVDVIWVFLFLSVYIIGVEVATKPVGH